MCATLKTYIIFALFLCTSTVETGEQCKLENGSSGKCEQLAKCRTAQEGLKQQIVPTMCEFTGSTPIVCCNDNNTVSSIPSVRISEQKCREYRTLFATRIIRAIIGGGGVDAKPNEFPHMALLGYSKGGNDSIQYRCGGSLISGQFILTAAHCLQTGDLELVSVRLGELDTVKRKRKWKPQNFKVIEMYPHPDYKFGSFYNDIALLELDRPVTFSRHIKPACLQSTQNFPGDRLTATGWGALYFGGGMHNILQKLELRSLPQINCLPTYGPQRNLKDGFDEELQICGGNLEKSVDTCQGDSGGPLQFRIQQKPPVYRVVGVTSFGKHCNLVPGIYTRVSKYISWIESVVWSNYN